MSEAKHTPGPWTSNNDGCNVGDWWEVKDAKGRNVAVMRNRMTATTCGHDEEGANARLISAAPDLLAACRVGVMALLLERGAAHIGDAKIFLDLATAAIKKATGGPE